MENIIVNAHVIDSRNIGDLASSPVKYFDFKYPVETLDIRSIDPKFTEPKSGFGGSITLDQIKSNADQVKYHLIVGGGGLLFNRFFRSFEILDTLKSVFRGQWIAWGIGQQVYSTSDDNLMEKLTSSRDNFNYEKYLKSFDLVGIRDIDFQYDWLPCASCLDSAFDQPREIKHDFVVFSHRKFELKIDRFPTMSHDTQSLEEVINFLGSGETIITSSYHGAYWGTLLGRKVIAFPFSTKFLTFKHPPSIYPVSKWKYSQIKFRPFKRTFLNKINIEFRYADKYTCQTNNWRDLLTNCTAYPNLLQEYREANLEFYQKTMQLLEEN
jgi:hypothetical protein